VFDIAGFGNEFDTIAMECPKFMLLCSYNTKKTGLFQVKELLLQVDIKF
jgi:hypothetical protein